MKKHLTNWSSILLALALFAGALPAAFAAAAPDTPPAQQEETDLPREVGLSEEPRYSSRLYVDGTPVAEDDYQNVKCTNYITVQAFVAIVEPDAAVSEENGTVRVRASSVSLTAVIGEEKIQANGGSLPVSGGSRYVNGLVALPVRVLATAFRMDVNYDSSIGVAFITRHESADVAEALPGEPADPPEAEATEEPAAPQYTSGLYVNGVPVAQGSYLNVQNCNYITVQAFMAIVDPAAAVSEWNGTVSVKAASGNAALSMIAGAGNVYLQANDRCLYVPGGNRYVNGLVAVPVRVMAAVFNMDVSYDGSVQVAFLTPRKGAAPYLVSGSACYNGDSLYWLSRIISAESGNQPLNGQIAVGNVIMNRVNDKSGNWPNTVKGVIFQKNQFTPAASGSIYRTPNAQSVIAAKLVLEGVEILPTAKFFNAANLKGTWAARHRPYLCTIGGHAFYA